MYASNQLGASCGKCLRGSWVCWFVGFSWLACVVARGQSRPGGAVATYPAPAGDVQVVSNATPATAGEAEKVLYDNPLGRTVAEIPGQALISDDIKLAVGTGCLLRRYTVQVIGKANPNACAGQGASCGPVRIDFGFYNACPGAGGAPIDGTFGCVTNAPETYPDCMVMDSEFAVTEVEFVPAQAVSLPSSVWLGVNASRAYAGVVIGAPALAGYSGDIFDIIDFPCNAYAGGFPRQPHASFHASIYGDAACRDSCLVYQNIRSSRGGINAGANNCIADDIQLDHTCNLAEMEVGLRGPGIYDIELRRSVGGFPNGGCDGGAASMGLNAIGYVDPPHQGTHVKFLVTSSGLTVKRILFNPPIQLPSTRLFAVLVPNDINATWILTGRNASVGDTREAYYVWDGDTWKAELPATGVHGGMQITLTCADACPVGACCDQYLRDENNEAVCRDVPYINCPFPPKDSNLKPAWKEGVPCHVCEGGNRDGEPCRSDSDCGDSGTCVDNDPFLLPCGDSACCDGDGNCHNVTMNECRGMYPYDNDWQVGQYCAIEGQRCHDACFSAEGDCLSPKPYTCVGGTEDGRPCTSDGDCAGGDDGFCQDIVPRCVLGENDGMECGSDLDCIPGGSCAYSVCVGGARDGQQCAVSRECHESYCGGTSPGCGDHDCCVAVCNLWPGPEVYTDFCCSYHWSSQCAYLARALGCAPGPICKAGAIDADEPPDGAIDAEWAVDCNDGGDVQGIHALDVYGPPGSADPSCWSLCESSTAGAPNTIEQIVEYEPAHYRITLSRPITPGQCTSLVYNAQSGSPSTLTFAALPGDVDGNGTTNAQDILALIDILNGVMQPPWGSYSADVDRSGHTDATDVLAVIDLLRGAGACASWNNVSLPAHCGPCPGP